MVYEVRWSPGALKDVKGIADHIRKDSERYAEIVADKITGKQLLSSFNKRFE